MRCPELFSLKQVLNNFSHLVPHLQTSNSSSLAATVFEKVSLNQFWIPGASGDLDYVRQAVCSHFVFVVLLVPIYFSCLGRMLRCTFAVNPQKCFVDYETFHQHVGEKKKKNDNAGDKNT